MDRVRRWFLSDSSTTPFRPRPYVSGREPMTDARLRDIDALLRGGDFTYHRSEFTDNGTPVVMELIDEVTRLRADLAELLRLIDLPDGLDSISARTIIARYRPTE